MTLTALVVHGYHFGITDHEIYLPAVERALDSSAFPHDARFFEAQTRYMAFDEIAAGIIRLTRLSPDVAFFAVFVTTLYLLLLGCLRLAHHCFDDRAAEWWALITLVIVLPFPVAGTRVSMFDPYLHPRGIAITMALWAFVASVEGRPGRGAVWLVLAAAMHPLTALWSALHVACQVRWSAVRVATTVGGVIGVAIAASGCAASLEPAAGEYWREALSPAVFDVRYPINWPWYEWAGVLGPLVVLAYFAVHGRARGADRFADVSRRLLLSGGLGVVIALVLTAEPSRSLPLQPMRHLHLVYLVVLLFAGARIEQRFLKRSTKGRLQFIVPVAVGALLLHRTFPASPHVEWPWQPPGNAWAAAFTWARMHTPPDAYFALDPFYHRMPGVDTHGFRALAGRSRMVDAYTDVPVAAMSPALAEEWRTQARDLADWRAFTDDDFRALHENHGVSWVVVQQPHPARLACPYKDVVVAVCSVEPSSSAGSAVVR